MALKVAASAVRLVRKRKVLVLNGQFRPKRPENGLYQGHTARASVGNSISEAFQNPGSLLRPCAHLFTKTLFYPFCLIWRLDSGVALVGSYTYDVGRIQGSGLSPGGLSILRMQFTTIVLVPPVTA